MNKTELSKLIREHFPDVIPSYNIAVDFTSFKISPILNFHSYGDPNRDETIWYMNFRLGWIDRSIMISKGLEREFIKESVSLNQRMIDLSNQIDSISQELKSFEKKENIRNLLIKNVLDV
jgi:hypothetical protein